MLKQQLFAVVGAHIDITTTILVFVAKQGDSTTCHVAPELARSAKNIDHILDVGFNHLVGTSTAYWLRDYGAIDPDTDTSVRTLNMCEKPKPSILNDADPIAALKGRHMNCSSATINVLVNLGVDTLGKLLAFAAKSDDEMQCKLETVSHDRVTIRTVRGVAKALQQRRTETEEAVAQ